MKIFLMLMAVILSFLPLSADAKDLLRVGNKAPDFSVTDIYGNNIKLSDYLEKIVVLEWTNHKCPFVVKQYEGGNMQDLQKEVTKIDDVVWISIVSSAKGKQGNISASEAINIKEEQGAHFTTKILDESGDIGHSYGARTTPHMFVIDKEGNIAYKGAIDNNSSMFKPVSKSDHSYVFAAVNALVSGSVIDMPSTKP